MPQQKRKKQRFKRNSSQKLYDAIQTEKENKEIKEQNKNPKLKK